MAPKTWTAEDLEMGGLKINRVGDSLHIEQRYLFVNAGGDVIKQVAGGRVVRDVEWSNLPPGIQAALVDINAWTKAEALEQEGME